MARLEWDKANRRDQIRETRTPKGKPLSKPATEKQMATIRRLSRRLGKPPPDGIATRSGASAAIRALLLQRSPSRP